MGVGGVDLVVVCGEGIGNSFRDLRLGNLLF